MLLQLAIGHRLTTAILREGGLYHLTTSLVESMQNELFLLICLRWLILASADHAFLFGTCSQQKESVFERAFWSSYQESCKIWILGAFCRYMPLVNVRIFLSRTWLKSNFLVVLFVHICTTVHNQPLCLDDASGRLFAKCKCLIILLSEISMHSCWQRFFRYW